MVTTGDRLDKMKFMIPFLQAIILKGNMRGLLMNYALEHAYNVGETVKVRKGTKIREISGKRMLAEREVYTKGSLDDEKGV